MYEYFNLQAIQGVQLINFFCLVLIFLFVRGVFGAWSGALHFVLILLALNVFVHGGMALLKQNIDAVSLSIFFMLLLAAAEDFIFLSFFQYIHPSRKDTKQLGEMVFGTAPIANQADCLKVNINSFKKSSSAIVFR